MIQLFEEFQMLMIRIKNEDSDTHTFQRVKRMKNRDRMMFNTRTFQRMIHNYLENFKR